MKFGVFTHTGILLFVVFIVAGLTVYPETVYSRQQINQEQQQVTRDTSYVRGLNERASGLIDEGKIDSARVTIDEALSVSRILNDESGEAFAYANLGNLFLARGMPDSTIAKLSDPFERLNHTSRALHIGNIIATAHLQRDDYANALELYTQMYERAVREENDHIQAAISQNLGITYSALGDAPMAIDYYMQSLVLAEELSDSTTMAVLLDNLGSLNVAQENYELAERYHSEALEIGEKLGNLNYISNSHTNFGILYKSLEQYGEALWHYQQVLDIAEQTGNVFTPIQTMYNIGNVYHAMGDSEKAIENFEESLRLSEENNILAGSYYNRSGLGLVFYDRQEFGQSAENYRLALEAAQQLASTDLIRTSNQHLADALVAAGDTAGAYPYLKRYSEITDSLSRTEREEALARQETVLGLRTERENRELLEQSLQDQKTITHITYASLFIILIGLAALYYLYRKQKKANRLLREKTEELTEVNNVKDQLLSVLSHDLRTPLSSLKGVVFLIREGVFEDKDVKVALNEIDYQLQQGINTLSNYLQWAQNQRDGITANNEKLSLKPFIDDAIKEFQTIAVNKNVVIDNRIQNNISVLADEQLLRVIIRNLLSNAIKYVDKGDKVIVDLAENKDTVELMIEDTGIGIPDEEKEYLFKPFTKTKQGTNGESGTGLGLSITKDFCEKMGGKIRFESEKKMGTTFFVTLNKPDNHSE